MSTNPLEIPHPSIPEAQRLHGLNGVAQTPPLYDANAVSLATFFGTPVAGGWLMFLNQCRLGRSGRGWLILLCAAAMTGLIILVGWNIPQTVSSVIAILLVYGMRQTASVVQGKEIAAHIAQGGRLGSKWTAVGIALIFLAVLFGTVFLALFIPTYKLDHGPKVIVGSKDEVFYTGTATQSQAQAVGNDLKADGYFQDHGATVILDQSAGATSLSFVVKEGSWNDASTIGSFEEIARQVASGAGGLPVKVRLLNKDRDVQKESQVGSADFAGGDRIFYMGSATAADAQALAKSLKDQGFFAGNGADVFLSKHADGTALSFVVGDGVWDDAKVVGSFESIARTAASAVGGMPVRLRLERTTLDVKKDEVLK